MVAFMNSTHAEMQKCRNAEIPHQVVFNRVTRIRATFALYPEWLLRRPCLPKKQSSYQRLLRSLRMGNPRTTHHPPESLDSLLNCIPPSHSHIQGALITAIALESRLQRASTRSGIAETPYVTNLKQSPFPLRTNILALPS